MSRYRVLDKDSMSFPCLTVILWKVILLNRMEEI